MDDQILDLEDEQLMRSSLGKRFANLLIDWFITAIITIPIDWALDLILIELSFDPLSTAVFSIPNFFLGAFYTVLYYFLFENAFGKTPAKMLTRCKVVHLNGERPSTQDIVLRSLIRIVPFEPFSFLFGEDSGWHDNWTDTIVVDIT